MPGRAMQSPSGGSGTPSAVEARADAAPSPWTALEDHLESTKRSILAEIRTYPPPIAACDQQFNHLLEQRDRIARELSRLASMRRHGLTAASDTEALLAFINGADCIAPDLKADLLQQLHQRLSEPA
jgi:hypothetical protein